MKMKFETEQTLPEIFVPNLTCNAKRVLKQYTS